MQNKSFEEESIDFLIDKILKNLTGKTNTGELNINYMPTNEIHNSIISLEKLFNIKNNLL